MRHKSVILLLAFTLLCASAGYFFWVYSGPVSQGRRLAESKCSSCHQFPEPGLLPKEVWEKGVLPFMAFRMGLKRPEIEYRINHRERTLINKIIPEHAMVTESEFGLITSYYKEKAPDRLDIEASQTDPTTLFSVEEYNHFNAKALTLVHFDESSNSVFVGHAGADLLRLTKTFDVIDSVKLRTPPSFVVAADSTYYISEVGDLFPSDLKEARLVTWNPSGLRVSIDSLRRFPYFAFDNFDNDDDQEIVVCAFGNYTGALELHDAGISGNKVLTLSGNPGARMAYTFDWNNDGRKDIIALMTQGDERIVLYENSGDLSFREKVLYRFPPIYGSSYFELSDLNQDGIPEILYTNGDNGDHTNITKPYHAVRILKQNGETLEEVWRYSLPGAWQAKAADFDGDGISEIAAISLFPDKELGTPTFVYFDRDNLALEFSPHHIAGIPYNNWMTMELFDQEADGDMDIILGAFRFEDVPRQHARRDPPKETPLPSLVVLRNRQIP